MNNTYVPKTSTENWDSVMKLVLAIAGLPAPTEIDVAAMFQYQCCLCSLEQGQGTLPPWQLSDEQ